MKTQNGSWRVYLRQSLIEALAAMALFWVIYAGHQLEIVRSMAGDTAFSALNSILDMQRLDDAKHTAIKVYTIDKMYFEANHMLDEYNNTTYGAFFPRSKLATFIKIVDNLPITRQPVSLFIDYDMTDGTASFDSNDTLHISEDDKVFLRQLAADRNYSILLPKTSMRNFVERYAQERNNTIAQKIDAQIKQGTIIFVNVDALNPDMQDYRYNPMRSYPDSNKIYYNVALANWQLAKNGKLDESQLAREYNPEIFADQKRVQQEGEAIFKSNIISLTGWKNLSFSSVAVLDTNVSLHGKIVMIGVDFPGVDRHQNSVGVEVSGIENLANATKTVLFLDGSLERISLWAGLLIVFVIFFSVTMVSRYMLPLIPKKGKRILEYVAMAAILLLMLIISYAIFGVLVSLLLLSLGIGGIYAYDHYLSPPIWFDIAFELLLLVGIMMTASRYILVEYKLWFNWFIPVLIFYLDDVIIVWREYYNMSIKKGRQK